MKLYLALLLLAGGHVAGADPVSTPDAIRTGHDSYMTNCMICHGDKGLGDGVAAASLTPKPRNLTKDQFKNGLTKEKVYETLSKGLPGTAMPPFAQLSDSERWSLVFYILSIRAK